MASISLPDRGLNLSHLTKVDQAIFETSSVRKRKDGNFIYKNYLMTLKDLKEDHSIKDGVTFLKVYLYWLDHKQAKDYKREYESVDVDDGKHTYLKFKWEGEDLIMDNSKVIRKRFTGLNDLMPIFGFNQVLGEKMGWIRQDYKKDWEAGVNLQILYHNERIQTRGQYDSRNKDGTANLYMRVASNRAGETWFYLSGRVSWKFTNINRAFDIAVKHPICTLHVYFDVAGSSIVGSQLKDLLCEVSYPRQNQGKVYFEPEQIHLPLRREVIDIVEVQVTENTATGEELVKFKDDHTLVTLHFKKASE